jgi:hypothetical protein
MVPRRQRHSRIDYCNAPDPTQNERQQMKMLTRSYRWFAGSLLLVVLLLFAGGLGVHAGSSIKIQIIGAKHAVGQPMSVRLTNEGKDPLTICITCAGAIVVAKSPVAPNFDVEMQSAGKWAPVGWGAETSNCLSGRTIPGGESGDFLIQLSAAGRYRLKVTYAQGKLSDADAHKTCADIPAFSHSKVATSPEFDVVDN